MLEDSYMVHRIMQFVKDLAGVPGYLIYWHGDEWNYTHCTVQSAADLDDSAIEFARFLEKEKGYAAIMRDLQKSEHKYLEWNVGKVKDVFVRKTLPSKLVGLSNAELQALKVLPRSHGYWRFKRVEIEWLKIIDPTASFERPPLYLECWYNAPKKPVNRIPTFKYINEAEWTAEALAKRDSLRDEHDCNEKCCACHGFCRKCATHPEGMQCMLEDGLLKVVEKRNKPENSTYYYVFGCSPRQCSCPPNCPNSILERGRQLPLVIFYEPQIEGWGVRAITDIKMGTFISEYSGQVMTDVEAEPCDTVYQFACGSNHLVIDAQAIGNEARFFSHSCDPNLMSVRVYSEGSGNLYHKIALFAKRDIAAGEALTFDYHPNEDKPYRGYSTCRCGSGAKCRQWV